MDDDGDDGDNDEWSVLEEASILEVHLYFPFTFCFPASPPKVGGEFVAFVRWFWRVGRSGGKQESDPASD